MNKKMKMPIGVIVILVGAILAAALYTTYGAGAAKVLPYSTSPEWNWGHTRAEFIDYNQVLTFDGAPADKWADNLGVYSVRASMDLSPPIGQCISMVRYDLIHETRGQIGSYCPDYHESDASTMTTWLTHKMAVGSARHQKIEDGLYMSGEVWNLKGMNKGMLAVGISERVDRRFYQLTVSSSSGGRVMAPHGAYVNSYATVMSGDTNVVLTAEPSSGYEFSGWVGDTNHVWSPESSSTTVTLYRDYDVEATFTKVATDAPDDDDDNGVVGAEGEIIEFEVTYDSSDEKATLTPTVSGIKGNVDLHYVINEEVVDIKENVVVGEYPARISLAANQGTVTVGTKLVSAGEEIYSTSKEIETDVKTCDAGEIYVEGEGCIPDKDDGDDDDSTTGGTTTGTGTGTLPPEDLVLGMTPATLSGLIFGSFLLIGVFLLWKQEEFKLLGG